jgi:hypothetical protein
MKETRFYDLAEGDEFKGLTLVGDARQRVANFRESMTNFINLFTNTKLSSARFQVAIEEAATTSDFPILLGTMLDQQLLAAYKSLPNDYREYMKIGSQQDFRKSQLVKIWGLEKPLPRVAQSGEYKMDVELEGGIYMSLQKYGKSFGLTWEDIVNDRLGAFTDTAQILAKAAYKTEYRQATAAYAGLNPSLFAATGGTIPNPIDGGLVSNSDTLPFNAANLATVIGRVRRQVDINNEPIFFEKLHLVVPPSLEFLMWQTLNPAGLIVSGGDSTGGAKGVTQTSANVLKNYNIVPHVNPYLPIIDTANGNKSWYVFIDPADAPAIQFNFLRGHETPEVFMKQGNTTDISGGAAGVMSGSFENDRVDWKVRHVMGSVAIDPRAAYGCQVAG